MVVIPDEFLDGATACTKREQRMDVKAFVIDGPKKALHFAVGLRRIGAQQIVRNTQAGAHLLKPRQAVGMTCMPHGERERIVGQHGFNGIRQGGGHMLEERGGGDTRGISVNRDDRFTTEVIDRSKFEVIPGISERD